MTMTDPLGDMLTRIRNGQMRSLNKISIPFSVFRSKILEVLKQEGYISDFKLETSEKNKNILSVNLKYNDGLPVIKEIKRVSKPGRRIYASARSIPRIQNGLGLAIVKHILIKHRAELTIRSSQNKQTIFSIAFPVLKNWKIISYWNEKIKVSRTRLRVNT